MRHGRYARVAGRAVYRLKQFDMIIVSRDFDTIRYFNTIRGAFNKFSAYYRKRASRNTKFGTMRNKPFIRSKVPLFIFQLDQCSVGRALPNNTVKKECTCAGVRRVFLACEAFQLSFVNFVSF